MRERGRLLCDEVVAGKAMNANESKVNVGKMMGAGSIEQDVGGRE